VSQFDKDDVEAVGLVKFDFLGLTTLTILDWTRRYVTLLTPESSVDLAELPLDDAATFDIFRKGNTTAVFQFESRGMRDLMKQAPPTRFEDIVALVALYRPGPMELIPDYVARKSGRERVEYLDPRLAPILEPTYGVMVYQEQVMQIAQVIGGYTLGAADLLRRAMGKKKPEEMALQRDIFVTGAEKNQLARPKAVQLFDLMEKFAGYGFNRSHSAAYALVAYQTAYFKAHHASAFMAANLSLVMDDTDKVKAFYDDAVAQGLAILPPDINTSGYRFRPVDVGSIRYGPRRDQGHGRSRPSTRSSPPATPAARSPICSTSAAASTRGSSTGASSRRSCAPAQWTRSIHDDRRCSRRSAWRSTPANARSLRRRRFRCSARKRRHTSQR
jgi:DNA polymerase-3 subunit alpha